MAYTLQNAIDETRVHLNDNTENVWKDAHIIVFINDAIRIIKKTIPEYFDTLVKVASKTDNILIDDDYTYLLPLFASARCFSQDEQHYRATQNMNEFESRKLDMEQEIRNSQAYVDKVAEQDPSGELFIDYVVDVYHKKGKEVIQPIEEIG